MKIIKGLTLAAVAGATGVASQTFAATTAHKAKSQMTAQDQGTSASDEELTRKIRNEITDTKDLSVSAQNITVISTQGAVLLKGEVPSLKEKAQLEGIARRWAGAHQVTNQLTIAE